MLAPVLMPGEIEGIIEDLANNDLEIGHLRSINKNCDLPPLIIKRPWLPRKGSSDDIPIFAINYSLKYISSRFD